MTIIDYILPSDIDAYRGIIERAAEAKANHKAAPRVRGPLSVDQKIKKNENLIAKLQAKLEAMRAGDTAAGDATAE